MAEHLNAPLTNDQLNLMRVVEIEAASALAAERIHTDLGLGYDMSGDPELRKADPLLVHEHLLMFRGVSAIRAEERVPFPKPPYF